MRGSSLCRRKYVLPKDPRTTGQLRARAALTAASKAWSHHPQLTEEHRREWRVAGAKVRSRPRLYQSGPLTGQMYFVARNCSRDRAGRELLLRATDPVRQSSERRRQPAKAVSQVTQSQRVARSTWEQYRIYTGDTPSQYRPSTLRHSKAGRAVPSAPRACKAVRNVRNWATCGGELRTARLAAVKLSTGWLSVVAQDSSPSTPALSLGERPPRPFGALCAPEPPGKDGPLTPTLSPSEGERGNRR